MNVPVFSFDSRTTKGDVEDRVVLEMARRCYYYYQKWSNYNGVRDNMTIEGMLLGLASEFSRNFWLLRGRCDRSKKSSAEEKFLL